MQDRPYDARPAATGIRRQLPVWVIAVIAICCLVELGLIIGEMVYGAQLRTMSLFVGGFWSHLFWVNQGIYPGQPIIMFFTYGLMHSGLMHLGMNMISLAVLARELTRMISPGRMFLIYAVSQIAAALLFALMAPTAGPMVGASGAIFGLAGALVSYAAVIGYRKKRPLGPLWRGVLWLLVLNVALTILMPSIAWEAHLGGGIAGVLMGIAMAFMPARR